MKPTKHANVQNETYIYVLSQKHAATLAENKIDHDSCVSSMRLLSLCSLATEHEEIPYQVIYAPTSCVCV